MDNIKKLTHGGVDMEYTKKQIKNNWEKDIIDFASKLQYPFDENDKSYLAKSLSAIPEESSDKRNPLTSYSISEKSPDKRNPLTSYGAAINYNAPIGQEYDDYQYSYEEGYFKAFKLIIAGSSNDSESFLMPALFLARHYIELSLKDEIINVSIATGSKFSIGNKESHDLTELSNLFKKLLEENGLNVLQKKFFDIIESIDKLSPKSDEFRYTTDISGKYNLPIDFTADKESPRVINLIVLGQYLNYIYLHLYSLYFILEDNDESVLTGTIFDNPYVKGLLYGVVHSNLSNVLNKSSKNQISKKIKSCISSVISNNNLKKRRNSKAISNHLKIESSDIKVDKSDGSYQVLLNDSVLFMIFENNKSWWLKTQPLLDE